MAKIKRMFEVEALDGEVEHTIMQPRKGGGFTEKVVKRPAGYNVYLPLGHSIRVTEGELKRMKLDGRSGFVDLDTGEAIEDEGDTSLKMLVERNTRISPSEHRSID